eukprot:gene30887-38714_t
MNKEQLKAFLEPIDSTILTEQKETVYVMLADTLDVPADNCKKLVEYVPPAPSQDHRKGGGGGNYKLNKDVLKSNMMNPAFQQKFEAYKSCFNVLLATPRAAVPDPLTHTPSTIVDDDVADKWMNQVGEHQGADHSNLAMTTADHGAPLQEPSYVPGLPGPYMNQVGEHEGADQSNLATTTADHSASLPQLTYYDGEIYSTEQILNYCACLANQNSEVTKINEQLTNSYNQLKMENHQMQSRLYEAEALRVERTTTADRGAPRQEPSYVHPRLSMELDVEHQDANQSNLATTTADHDQSNLATTTADHGAPLQDPIHVPGLPGPYMNQVGEHQGADQSNLAMTTADHGASLQEPSHVPGLPGPYMNQVGEHQGADHSNLAMNTADHGASLPQLTYYDGEIYSTQQILNYCAYLANQNSKVTKINEQLTISYNQLETEIHQMQSRLYEVEALRVERERRINILEARLQGTSL